MPTTPYQDPSFDTTYQDPQYTAGAGALDTELGTAVSGIETSYARRRSDRVRSYQDTLDSIQYGMREAGIGLREGYASRQTYNADGSLSGVAQATATRVLDPLLRQARMAGENYASDIAGLEEQKTQDINQTRAQYGTRKTDLANQIYGSIRTAARQRFEDTQAQEQEDYNRGREAASDALKDPTSREYNRSIGRTYIAKPETLRRLRAKYGDDAIVMVGGKAYLRGEDERAERAASKAKTTTRTSTRTSGGGSTPKKQTQTEIRNSLISDLNNFGDLVAVNVDEQFGQGKMSREKVIDDLFEAYRDDGYTKQDIAKLVYETYPDK